MSFEIHKDHKKTNADFGSGSLIISQINTPFVEGNFFLLNNPKTMEEEQRVCITFNRPIVQSIFRSLKEPFGKIVFDKYIRIGNIPIEDLPVFLLSATIVGNHMDVVLSPKNKYIEKILN
ncbi:MAG: hypothetical protein GPJ54_00910 [Candidatus Heimdallarchaeota archaeon]|nr:hypothetical protein [Candidatus Heimdallarchaeota archaeon]